MNTPKEQLIEEMKIKYHDSAYHINDIISLAYDQGVSAGKEEYRKEMEGFNNKLNNL